MVLIYSLSAIPYALYSPKDVVASGEYLEIKRSAEIKMTPAVPDNFTASASSSSTMPHAPSTPILLQVPRTPEDWDILLTWDLSCRLT